MLYSPRTSRRAVLITGLGAALALAGCGGSSESSNTTSTAGGSSSTTTAATALPATIDTAYGKVTMAQKPARIVVLTGTYGELLSYLDEEPMGTTEDQESLKSYSPWAVDLPRGEVNTGLLSEDWTPSPEAVAALKPDLILADIWNVDQKVYAQLSEIAPTFVGIETDTQTSWQDNLGALAQLTGHDPAIVKQVEDEMAADFAAAAATLPGLQGKSYIVPVFYTDNQFWPTEYANDSIMALGMVPSAQQPHGDVTSAEVAKISRENIDKLTEDVVFLASSGAVSKEVIDETFAAVKKDPRVAELPASKNGTWLYLDSNQWNAINGGTPLSYRWWLTQVLPTLQASALNTATN